jgi:hypothetical protein
MIHSQSNEKAKVVYVFFFQHNIMLVCVAKDRTVSNQSLTEIVRQYLIIFQNNRLVIER